MPTASSTPRPVTVNFADDGTCRTIRTLPFVLYRGAIDLTGTPDPERLIEQTFAANGWGDMWRNGIFPFAHYHSMIHEALGVARGRASVRFGGDDGEEIEIAAGDVAILPAGTGHQWLSQSHDLLVIGAYPPSGTYDLCRGSKADHARGARHDPARCRCPRPIRCTGRRAAARAVARA